jgi:predicted nucleic acid-binding protein
MELSKINGKNVYIDANIFIYAIEDNEEYKEKISALFSRIIETKSMIITSELTLTECLVKPYSENDKVSILNYEAHIKNSDFLMLKPLPLDLLKKSAQLRGMYKNKLPDSIHLATALSENCNVFITNDIKIKVPDNIELLALKNITI